MLLARDLEEGAANDEMRELSSDGYGRVVLFGGEQRGRDGDASSGGIGKGKVCLDGRIPTESGVRRDGGGYLGRDMGKL